MEEELPASLNQWFHASIKEVVREEMNGGFDFIAGSGKKKHAGLTGTQKNEVSQNDALQRPQIKVSQSLKKNTPPLEGAVAAKTVKQNFNAVSSSIQKMRETTNSGTNGLLGNLERSKTVTHKSMMQDEQNRYSHTETKAANVAIVRNKLKNKLNKDKFVMKEEGATRTILAANVKKRKRKRKRYY